jgi:hypothetical protein
LVPEFMQALTAATEEGASGEATGLTRACEAAATLRQQLLEHVPRRPWKLVGSSAEIVANGLVDFMRTYLEAISAHTPVEAQTLASRAQKLLDDLGASTEELGNLLERWLQVAETSDLGEMLARNAVDAFASTPATGLLGLDQYGAARYESITGRTPTTGVGLTLLQYDLWSRVVGDQDVFQRTLRHADGVLASRRVALARAWARPTVVEELRNGWQQLGDQVIATQAIVAAAANERVAVRSVVQLIHTLLEGPGRRFAALLLEAVGKQEFERHLTRDGARAVRLVEADPKLAGLLAGLNESMRHAYAHLSFETHDDGIMVRHQSGATEFVGVDGLLDHLLAAEECVAAVGLALQAVALEAGIDLSGQKVLDSFGLHADDVIVMVISLAGAEDIRIDRSSSIPVVEMTVVSVTAGLVGGLASFFANESTLSLRVRSPHDDEVHEWEFCPSDLRAYLLIPEGLTREVAFVDAMSRVRCDGQPALDDAGLQHWIIGRACTETQAPIPKAQRSLRALVNFAQSRGFDELTSVLKGLMRFVRVKDSDLARLDDTKVGSELRRFVLDPPPRMLLDIEDLGNQ